MLLDDVRAIDDICDSMYNSLETATGQKVFRIRMQNGNYVCCGKRNGIFTSRSGAMNALGRRIRSLLRWHIEDLEENHGLNLGNYTPWAWANENYKQIRNRMLDRGILEIIEDYT